jgi:DNA polymerase III delta prime subunit
MAHDTKESDGRGSKPSAFGSVFEFAEYIAKAFTAFVGTIYVIGYIVTAARLAQYGVATTRLLDAQYLVAGLLPGLLVWLTALCLISAIFNEPPRGHSSAGCLGLFILCCVVLALESLILFTPLGRSGSELRQSLLNATLVAVKFVLGELALWFLIVGWRTRYSSTLTAEFTRKGEGPATVLLSMAACVVLGAIALYQIPVLGWRVYNGLPQSYGGAKPLRIELYVDGTKVPGEMLATQADKDQSLPARTIPLNLILKTAEEYVVGPLGDGNRRVWVLKTEVVHAEQIVEAGFP